MTEERLELVVSSRYKDRATKSQKIDYLIEIIKLGHLRPCLTYVPVFAHVKTKAVAHASHGAR